MAHLVETMAYAGELPWHGLGKAVSNELAPDEMLKEAGLDWTVERRAQFINWKEKKIKTGRDVLVRSTDGRILTHISKDWNEVQNHEAADFFHDFVMEGDMEMHTAGSLKGGCMVWFLARIKKSFKVGNGKDVVDSFLLFSLPHEYGKCLDIRFTPIRVVCNNTLTLALQTKGDMMIKLNHTKKFDPEIVKKTLGIADQKMTEYSEMAEFLANRKATKEQVHEYIKSIFPKTENSKRNKEGEANVSKPAKTALSVVETQPGADLNPDSWWNAFNAVTYSIDHLLGHGVDTRLTSAWYGPNRSRKIEALKKAVELAKVS